MPKSRDAESGVDAFSAVSGIEVPAKLWEKEYVVSGGRSFRLVPGADMANQIAAGWGDIAICSTELVAEANQPSVIGCRIGEMVCRYSVLALDQVADHWRDFLQRSARYPKQVRMLPASFPLYLTQIAIGRDLPLVPMGVQVSGKAEATMFASGVGAVADRIVTGRTVRALGGQEVFELAKIYPELIVRRQDADAYRTPTV